jgi:hypothetical protein
VQSKQLRAGAAATLKEELLTLKYLGSNSPFLRGLAEARASQLGDGKLMAVAPSRVAKPKSKPAAGAKAKK